jgi:NAD(P)-dependent dehydrogenase (short-subunit alcohol dehydrogenase family)/uncharacterized OB-fold protein
MKPHLPPAARGPLGRRLTAAAAFGRLELPVCEDCRRVQYPLRERCGACLSDRLRWAPVEPSGTLLASTKIRHSNEPYFQARRPIPIGSVALDAGPVAICFLGRGCDTPGRRVRIVNQLDRAGEGILIALAEHASPEEANVMSDPNREIAGRTVLVTGANGGIGRALVAVFRKAGAAEVIEVGGPSFGRDRSLDVTDAGAVEALARELGGRIDILVNNAGANANSGALAADRTEGARREMEVNYFGLLSMLRAFTPAMRARRSGVIINILSMLSHVNLPALGSYCASKAAAQSLTQAARAELMPWGIRVIGVLPGAVDTRMSERVPPPKLAPAQLADAVVKAIQEGNEDVYPGAVAERVYEAWRRDPKALEREMATRLPPARDL